MTTFVCTIEIDNFCMHYYNRTPQMHLKKIFSTLFQQTTYQALLQFSTFVCIIGIEKFCMHLYWQYLNALLQLTTCVFTNAIAENSMLQKQHQYHLSVTIGRTTHISIITTL